MKRQVLFVAGARPNFMKIAPLLRAHDAAGAPFDPVLVHTGQHYDAAMSDVFFRDLGLPEPDVHLGVGSGSHGEQTAAVLRGFAADLAGRDPAPAGVVVVGDVNSTLACSLAAFRAGVPVAHVEAGLRSFDRAMPEEINRLVTDALSDLLFVTEPAGRRNLLDEGTDEARIHDVGDVMIDTLRHEIASAGDAAVPGGLEEQGYVFVTLHRPSNVDEGGRLEALLDLLEFVAERLPLVLPLHPRTAQRLEQFGLRDRVDALDRLRLLPPAGYRDAVALLRSSRFVLTDSGGLQAEAAALGIPCLTLRSNTERPITLETGLNRLVGADLDEARGAVDEVLDGPPRSPAVVEGWDGRAAERIMDILVREWGS